MRRRLGYLHVPKTAGTSVTSAIRAAVDRPADAAVADGVDADAAATTDLAARPGGGPDTGSGQVAPFVMDTSLFGGFTDFDRMPTGHGVFRGDPAELAPYDVVLGHFAVSTLLAGREPADLVALFREPRARLLSLYTYWRSWPEDRHASWDPYEASRMATRLDWPDFLAEPAVAAQVDNAATRLLLTPHELIPPDGFIAADHVPRLLDDARAAVDRLGHADVIERGEPCWTDLSAWLGVEVHVGHERTTSDERRLDPAIHFTARGDDVLAARSVLDAEVWRHAARRHGLDGDALDRLADRTWSERRAAASTSDPAPGAPSGGASGDGDTGRGAVRARVAAAWRRASRRRADR